MRPACVRWCAPWFRWGGCEQVAQSQHGRDGHSPFLLRCKVQFQSDNGIRVAGEMIAKILLIIESAIHRIHTQSRLQGLEWKPPLLDLFPCRFRWLDNFLCLWNQHLWGHLPKITHHGALREIRVSRGSICL